MWTATIAEKVLKEGTLSVVVSFLKDSKHDHSQSFNVSSEDQLSRGIQASLDRLSMLEQVYEDIEIGDFTSPPPVVVDTKITTLDALGKLQHLVDLEVIAKGDPDYVSALDAAKSAHGK